MTKEYLPCRHSIRLQNYDYSNPGYYFVTICSQNRECLFGEVVKGVMVLNEQGKIVTNEWIKTGQLRHNINLDEFVVMPNHIHGIIQIVSPLSIHRVGRGMARHAPTDDFVKQGRFGKPVANSISTISAIY